MPRTASERVPAHEAGCDGEAGPGRNHLNARIAAHPVRNQARGRDWTMRGTRPPAVTARDCRLALGPCLLKFISLASRRSAAANAAGSAAFHPSRAAASSRLIAGPPRSGGGLGCNPNRKNNYETVYMAGAQGGGYLVRRVGYTPASIIIHPGSQESTRARQMTTRLANG
jgi:hypothetical protein